MRNAKCLSRLLARQTCKVSKLDKIRFGSIFLRQLLQRFVQVDQIVGEGKIILRDIDVVKWNSFIATSTLETLLLSGIINQDAFHSFCRSHEEMPFASPILLFQSNQSNVSLMH